MKGSAVRIRSSALKRLQIVFVRATNAKARHFTTNGGTIDESPAYPAPVGHWPPRVKLSSKTRAMKCPASEQQTDISRSRVQTRAGASTVESGATALDDDQERRGRLLLLGEGAVLAHRLARPL